MTSEGRIAAEVAKFLGLKQRPVGLLTGGIEARCTGTHGACGEVIARVHELDSPT